MKSKFLQVALLSALSIFTTLSCAQSSNPNDAFKALSEQPTVWCLNKEFLVIQPWNDKFWKHSNKVPLTGLSHTTACEPGNLLQPFDEMEVSGTPPNLKLTLKSGGQPVNGYKNLPLTRDTHPDHQIHPRYWTWDGPQFDLYLLMAEKRNSKQKLVRYYLLEAFRENESAECNAERPDKSGLVEVDQGVDCDHRSLLQQTGVSGGGEGK